MPGEEITFTTTLPNFTPMIQKNFFHSLLAAGLLMAAPSIVNAQCASGAPFDDCDNDGIVNALDDDDDGDGMLDADESGMAIQMGLEL